MFSHFGRIDERDGWTGDTARRDRPRLCIAPRAKNVIILFTYYLRRLTIAVIFCVPTCSGISPLRLTPLELPQCLTLRQNKAMLTVDDHECDGHQRRCICVARSNAQYDWLTLVQ